MTSHVLKTTLAAAALLLCTACSQNPLDTLENAQPLEELYGTWIVVSSQDEPSAEEEEQEESRPRSRGILQIGGGGEDYPENVVLMAVTRIDSEGKLIFNGAAGYATKIGEETYMNIPMYMQQPFENQIPSWDPSQPHQYLFLRYKVVEGELRIYKLDTERMEALIASGELGGESGHVRGSWSIVTFTATSEELRDCLAAGDTFFEDEPLAIFRRLELPAE